MAHNTRSKKKKSKDVGGEAASRSSSIPAVVTLESDLESTASIVTNGSRKTYETIPKPILKQLFYDIEHAGGLHEFDKGVKQGLAILLDQGEPEIYGVRGDGIRRRLTCKVSDWKKLTQKQYHRRLFKLGVQPADTLLVKDIVSIEKKKQGAIRTIPEEVVPDEIDLVHAPVVVKGKRQAQPKAAPNNNVPRKVPPADKDFIAPAAKPTTNTMKGARILFEGCLLRCICRCSPLSLSLLARTGANTIILNLEAPGDQGEGLQVHKIAFKDNNALYQGVEISIECDIRDAMSDKYTLTFKENGNDAVFTKPAMSASYRMDKAQFDPRVNFGLRAPVNHDYIIDGRDAARTALEKAILVRPDAGKRKFEVLFPDGYRLSQKPFGHVNGKDGEFRAAVPKVIIYKKLLGVAIGGTEPEQVHASVTWRFVNMASEAELNIVADPGAAAVLAGLAGL